MGFRLGTVQFLHKTDFLGHAGNPTITAKKSNENTTARSHGCCDSHTGSHSRRHGTNTGASNVCTVSAAALLGRTRILINQGRARKQICQATAELTTCTVKH